MAVLEFGFCRFPNAPGQGWNKFINVRGLGEQNDIEVVDLFLSAYRRNMRANRCMIQRAFNRLPQQPQEEQDQEGDQANRVCQAACRLAFGRYRAITWCIMSIQNIRLLLRAHRLINTI